MESHEHPRTLLAVFAHPDDESFGCGGTLAYYASQGARVALVCTTRGEVGEISDPNLATPDNLGEVREQELRKASEILGLAELTFFDYRDSGMAGTSDNEHPRAFTNAPEDEVVARIVGVMRRLKPQVVITFDPNGGYGHPDHIAAHLHTVAAFHAAGDSRKYPEAGEPWQPNRLFYTVFPRSIFSKFREKLKEFGLDTTEIDEFDQAVEVFPEEKITVTLDASGVIDVKWAALQQHRSQLNQDNPFNRLPEDVTKGLFSREFFALASPDVEDGFRLSDLFEGL